MSSQPSEGQCAETWRGIALLAMSTLLYERFFFLVCLLVLLHFYIQNFRPF